MSPNQCDPRRALLGTFDLFHSGSGESLDHIRVMDKPSNGVGWKLLLLCKTETFMSQTDNMGHPIAITHDTGLFKNQCTPPNRQAANAEFLRGGPVDIM